MQDWYRRVDLPAGPAVARFRLWGDGAACNRLSQIVLILFNVITGVHRRRFTVRVHAAAEAATLMTQSSQSSVGCSKYIRGIGVDIIPITAHPRTPHVQAATVPESPSAHRGAAGLV